MNHDQTFVSIKIARHVSTSYDWQSGVFERAFHCKDCTRPSTSKMSFQIEAREEPRIPRFRKRILAHRRGPSYLVLTASATIRSLGSGKQCYSRYP